MSEGAGSRMDCVLGHHMNPLTCGIAKFNTILARRCEVPFLRVTDSAAARYRRPLLSIKASELGEADLRQLDAWLEAARERVSLRVFVHAYGETPLERRMIEQAATVYCGNAQLAARLRRLRGDVHELWCPGTLLDTRHFGQTELSVFSFGMAHKMRSDHYGRLRELLAATGRSYCLYLSTALHENTSFDDSFSQPLEELRGVFDNRVHFLGYLSDSAVFNYVSEATFFAAFFDEGVRANNTSVNAAMLCGAVVLTNLDRYSPPAFVHGENLLDIGRCEALPLAPGELRRISGNARETAEGTLGWERLVSALAELDRA